MEFPTKTRESKSIFTIASPAEDRKSSSSEGVRAGAKAAAVACVASAIPTLIAVRKIPWAKANINHTGQALIVSAASIAAFFVTADKTVLQSARKNSHFERTT
ncbi:early nodulin-93-like isoform X1 [Mangifera indica]|uniref:early nodulin-93-like isoform X1 n=1 Tax=Mangifera indica TaxID=29780 RepID=UPI001CFAC40C|nr:early nodulin-93-like isoform X1 [Mangifera indica]